MLSLQAAGRLKDGIVVAAVVRLLQLEQKMKLRVQQEI